MKRSDRVIELRSPFGERSLRLLQLHARRSGHLQESVVDRHEVSVAHWPR